MLRAFVITLALALLTAGWLAPPTVVTTTAWADEEKKSKPLALASDAEVKDALKQFKEEYAAKGLKGDDKLSQRDYAMRNISEIQHPEIIKALGKVSRAGDPDLRMLALIYLGDQKALPHLAAQHVLKAVRKHKKDIVLTMTGLQTLGQLKYLGAAHDLRQLIKHKYFVIRKTAIATVGTIGDVRMLSDVLKILGVKIEKEKEGSAEPDKKSGGKETVSEGYSWEGAEAVVDYGDADNSVRENPEAKAKAEAQIAKNKAAAAAAAGRGGGSGGGGGGASTGSVSGGRGGSSRSVDELIPTILRTLKQLTGEEFRKPSSIKNWVKANRDHLKFEKKRLDGLEKAQKTAAKK